MNPNKALWEKGDFTRLAVALRSGAEKIIESLGVKAGDEVLDVGCGDGSTAIPSAKRGANVLGVDIASNLVAAGNRRAQEMGLTNIKFQEGDACDLEGIPDHHYDYVVSVFGAMFAPRPNDVAKSLVRVVKPGGKILMGNWIPNDPTLVSQSLRISAAYAPPPPEGFISPMLWGVESNIIERFTQAGIPAERVHCSVEQYVMEFPASPAEFVATFRDYYGPTINAFAAAEANGKRDELQAELDDLFTRENKNKDPNKTEIHANYMRVIVDG